MRASTGLVYVCACVHECISNYTMSKSHIHYKLLLMLRLTVIVKIMEQRALIPSHLLALHLQRKYARVYSKNKRYYRSVSTKRKYSKSWEKDFSWLYYHEDSEGAFCKQSGISGLQCTGGVWVTNPFNNWKKAV